MKHLILTLICVLIGTSASAQSWKLQHETCNLDVTLFEQKTVVINRKIQNVGVPTIVANWWADINGERPKGSFFGLVGNIEQFKYDSLKTFAQKGYSPNATLNAAKTLSAGENGLHMEITLLCNADNEYFCVAANRLYQVQDGKLTMLNRGAAPLYSSSEYEEAVYGAIASAVNTLLPTCEKISP